MLCTFKTKNIHISCLFLPAQSSYDRYFFSEHAFYRKHFWCFSTFRTKNVHVSCLFLPAHSHLEQRIYTCLVCSCQRTLATINIPFRARITNRSRFIESISGCFPHLERRIYTYPFLFLSAHSRVFLPAHSSYGRYSLSSKNYEPLAFYIIESISGAFHI